jgi:predicted permease
VLRRVRSFLRALTCRSDFEAGMSEEMQFHLDQYASELMRSGVPESEARRRSQMEFGFLNSVKDDCRQARSLHWVDELARNLRYAVRSLRKTPRFTATALLTLAVCIGANLTIFAVSDAILLRPLPFPHPDRLVTIYNTYPKANVPRDGANIADYYEFRGHIPAFESVSLYSFGTATVGNRGSTLREPVTRVTPEFFTTLGEGPMIGRVFTDTEMNYQTDGVAILSDGYWKEYFHGDPHVIGQKVWVDGFPRTVVGVLPSGFRFLSSNSQLYLPLSSNPEQRTPAERHSGGNVVQMIARLRPGATVAQAQSQIDAENDAEERYDPNANLIKAAGFRSLVVPLHADQVASIRPVLVLLQAGVFVLLLIGMVNLVNLLLVRATVRSKELSVRQALGASRAHVMREIATETTLLTLLGGLLGLPVAAGGIRLVAALGADRLPFGTEIAFNGRLALVAVAAVIILGVALAAPIASFHLRSHPANALQSEARGGTAGRATQTLRHGFIVTQIALAFVLLTGAALLGMSLKRAMEVSPGFRSDHAIAGQLSLIGSKYPTPESGFAFIEALVSKLENQPGVLSAGVATNIPFSPNNGKSAATVEGYAPRPGESPRGSYSYGVAGNYFQAMGLTLKAGRFLTSADSRRAARVCVVDEDFARYYWPGKSALGRRLFQGIKPGPEREAFTVVGVVGSIKQVGLTDDTAQGAVYYPYIYRPDYNLFAVVRGSVRTEALGLFLQKTVRRVDPDLAVSGMQSMDDRIAESLMAWGSPAVLGAIFSGIALLLVVIGIYGTLSYAVAQRRREIAVRIALGAQPEHIRAQFFSLALRLLTGGTMLGLIGAWLAGQAMQAVLFHVRAHSPAILVGSAAVIALVSLMACLLPAQRAARISPMQALSEE